VAPFFVWWGRNYFLLSFYLIGISFVDLAYLKWTDIKDGRVVYKRRETGKIYNIKLVEKANPILNYSEKVETGTTFILPIIPASVLGDSIKKMYNTRQGSKIRQHSFEKECCHMRYYGKLEHLCL
jgi:hypothetical protein